MWALNKDQLINYFRKSDKTSDVIGGRQASVFVALRDIAGYRAEEPPIAKPKITNSNKSKTLSHNKSIVGDKAVKQESSSPVVKHQSNDMALTVRIEINLPTEATSETYDAIFKSIKANLFS